MDALLQGKELQDKIIKTLRENISATVYKNREDFTNKILELLPEIKTNKSLVKGIVLAMSEDSDEGMKYYDKKGKVESDPDLKDIETIPYKQPISEYYEQEVKPFVDDAWLEEDQNKIRISCIIKQIFL